MACRARAICISNVSRTVRGKPSSTTAGGRFVGTGVGGGVSRAIGQGWGLGMGTGATVRGGTATALVCGTIGAALGVGVGGDTGRTENGHCAGKPGCSACHQIQPPIISKSSAANQGSRLPRFWREADEWFRRRGGTRGFSHSPATRPSLFDGLARSAVRNADPAQHGCQKSFPDVCRRSAGL